MALVSLKGLSKALDTRLLKTIEQLLRAGKFNRVADLVAFSEPIAAFVLAKLREMIDDPLLIPTAAGVELTARARRLAVPFRDLLERIQEIVPLPELFDPAFCEDTFAIAVTDYAGIVLAPPLAAAFAERAPRATLAVQPLDTGTMRRALESGTIDLAIGALSTTAAKLRSQRVLQERWRCVARKGHPRVSKQLSARQYADEAHVLLAPTGARAAKADPAFSDPGRKRRAGVTVPHYLLVPDIVAQSDLVATLPERVARSRDGRLQVLAPPVRLPGFDVSIVWHERNDAEPAHLWLRRLVVEVADAV